MADLRPIHSNINITKYDAICCPNCGFAALAKNFSNTTATQRKLIREKISSNYKSHPETTCDVYTTEMAISRMKMVLFCTITKGGKDSEIGNVCLKISWLYQDLADELPADAPDTASKKELYLKEAENAAMNANDRLTSARMHEGFPIAGMNETTLDYLLAYYAFHKGEYQTAMQLLSGVVTSRSVSPRLKDKKSGIKGSNHKTSGTGVTRIIIFHLKIARAGDFLPLFLEYKKEKDSPLRASLPHRTFCAPPQVHCL